GLLHPVARRDPERASRHPFTSGHHKDADWVPPRATPARGAESPFEYFVRARREPWHVDSKRLGEPRGIRRVGHAPLLRRNRRVGVFVGHLTAFRVLEARVVAGLAPRAVRSSHAA